MLETQFWLQSAVSLEQKPARLRYWEKSMPAQISRGHGRQVSLISLNNQWYRQGENTWSLSMGLESTGKVPLLNTDGADRFEHKHCGRSMGNFSGAV